MTLRLLAARLRSRPGVWISLLVLASTLVASRVVEHIAAGQARERAAVTLTTIAEQIAVKLDRAMFERYREFQLLSERPTLGDPGVPLAEKQRLLDEMKRTHGAYAWIGATDASGKVVAAADGLLAGADVSQRPWFRNALNNSYVGDVHDAKLLAAKLPNYTGEPLRFVDIAFPYRDPSGKIVGILGAHVHWSWANEIQRSVVARYVDQGPLETFIVASDGTVVLGPADSVGKTLSVRRAAGTREVVVDWGDGASYVTGYSPTRGFQSYPGLGWSVVVRQPTAVALAPARAASRQVMWIGCGLALLCLVFAVAMPRPLGRSGA